MKRDGRTLNNFNISVAITDEFMKSLKRDGEYWLYNPYLKKKTVRKKARDIFKLIVESAWEVGDPGLIFIDRINQLNPTRELGPISATNPCGEQPLHPYESCNLGSINISNFYSPGHPDEIDWERLAGTIEIAVRFLDNVIDVNKYPLPQIAQMTMANRKIGLGVMGWADMLIKLGIPYNTDEAIELAEKVMKFINEQGHGASQQLARKRGPFPNFKGSIYDKKGQPPLRNATVTTIAPTGTISIIANASSGVEPLFAVSYVRQVMDNDILVEVHPYFEALAKARGFYSPELMQRIAEHGTIHDLEEIPEDIRQYFVTAHEISPEIHIKMQAAFQKYTDNAVSKTVNFKKEATVQDVARVYELAYKLDCKGVTIYRDGSRDQQVLSKGKKKKQPCRKIPTGNNS